MNRPGRALLGLIALALALAGCTTEPETGPGTVRWDRTICERCAMAVSDHNFAAQIRGGAADAKTKLHFFDDFGCAVLWLAEQPWREDPRTEIWVADYRDGTWREARHSRFVTGQITPMDFGLGAGSDSSSLDYEQAVTEVRDREARLHGAPRKR